MGDVLLNGDICLIIEFIDLLFVCRTKASQEESQNGRGDVSAGHDDSHLKEVQARSDRRRVQPIRLQRHTLARLVRRRRREAHEETYRCS